MKFTQTLLSSFTLLASALAITITGPASLSTFPVSQTIPVTFTSVNTDPSTITIQLVNFSKSPTVTQTLASNFAVSSGVYNIPAGSLSVTGTGFQINIISTTNGGILAQSGQFTLTSATSSSSSSVLSTSSTSSRSSSVTSVSSTSIIVISTSSTKAANATTVAPVTSTIRTSASPVPVTNGTITTSRATTTPTGPTISTLSASATTKPYTGAANGLAVAAQTAFFGGAAAFVAVMLA